VDLKEKLLLYSLKKKYESQYGIKSFSIHPLDELTKKERSVIDDIYRVGSPCVDKLSLSVNYPEQIYWIKQKVRPYLSYNSEIIIFDNGHLIILLLEDIETFLHQHLKDDKHTLIINRDSQKCICVFVAEYDLEFFERNI
jgi:hypothetical protein